MTSRVRVAALAVGLACVASNSFAYSPPPPCVPPPPPPPPRGTTYTPMCGDRPEAFLSGTPITPTIKRITPAEVIVGPLGPGVRFRGAVQVSSDEFAGVVGLTLDQDHGFVAVTEDGRWLKFDVGVDREEGLWNIRDAWTAPIRGLQGKPSALMGTRREMSVALADQPTVQRFDFARCGVASQPWTSTTFEAGQAAEVLVTVAYGFTLAGGETPGGWGEQVFLCGGAVKFEKPVVEPVSGYDLREATSSYKIVPYQMIGLWRARDGSGTLMRSFNLPQWDDTAGLNYPSIDIARLKFEAGGVAAFGDESEIGIFVVSKAAAGRPVTIAYFTWTPPKGTLRVR